MTFSLHLLLCYHYASVSFKLLFLDIVLFSLANVLLVLNIIVIFGFKLVLCHV